MVSWLRQWMRCLEEQGNFFEGMYWKTVPMKDTSPWTEVLLWQCRHMTFYCLYLSLTTKSHSIVSEKYEKEMAQIVRILSQTCRTSKVVPSSYHRLLLYACSLPATCCFATLHKTQFDCLHGFSILSVNQRWNVSFSIQVCFCLTKIESSISQLPWCLSQFCFPGLPLPSLGGFLPFFDGTTTSGVCTIFFTSSAQIHTDVCSQNRQDHVIPFSYGHQLIFTVHVVSTRKWFDTNTGRYGGTEKQWKAVLKATTGAMPSVFSMQGGGQVFA